MWPEECAAEDCDLERMLRDMGFFATWGSPRATSTVLVMASLPGAAIPQWGQFEGRRPSRPAVKKFEGSASNVSREDWEKSGAAALKEIGSGKIAKVLFYKFRTRPYQVAKASAFTVGASISHIRSKRRSRKVMYVFKSNCSFDGSLATSSSSRCFEMSVPALFRRAK
jgi:hypothetical protein